MADSTRQGWVRFYRQSIDSSVFKNPNIWFVWSWCLLKANHSKNIFPFNGFDITIEPGQFITGMTSAIKELHSTLSPQNYRTAIRYLKSTGRITVTSNNKFSIITIVKWENYQTDNSLAHKPLTNEQQATNKPLTTNKNDKKEKNENNNIPASQDSLKINNTKTMKKNSFGKYREDMSIDSFETVIDADTGEEEKYKPKGSNAKLMAELIEWATKRRGGNFVNLGKQYKAISNLKQAKIPPEAIKNRWLELESDEYHKTHGLDFMSVASSFDKKPL